MIFLVKLFLNLTIYSIFVIFYIYKSEISYNLSELVKLSNQTFYLNESKTWVKLNRNIYFKRTSFYYLIDHQHIRFTFLIHSDALPEFNFSICFKIDNEQKMLSGNFSKMNVMNNVQQLNYTLIPDRLEFPFEKATNIKIKFQDKTESTEYIEVTNKYITNPNHKTKNLTTLCSKCFFFKTPKEYLDHKWWLEMNTRFGYDKISICENYLNMEYFSEFSKVLQLESIRSAPNFINTTTEFIYSFYDFINGTEFYFPLTDVISLQVINECYYRNAEKTKYISVYDGDELIIPRLDEKYFTINDFRQFIMSFEIDDFEQFEKHLDQELKCKRHEKPLFKNYLDEIKSIYNRDNTKESIYFLQGIYHRYETVQELFRIISLNLKFNTTNYTISISTDKIPFMIPNKTLHIYFDDRIDNLYAKKLLDINEKYYKVFVKKYHSKLKHNSEKLQRLFMHIDEKGFFLNGKSVFTTNITGTLCLHTICNKHKFRNTVPTNFGHVSHFREVYYKGRRGSFNISIKQIIFDINYLSCFVIPKIKNN